jgi:hypothetical protein
MPAIIVTSSLQQRIDHIRHWGDTHPQAVGDTLARRQRRRENRHDADAPTSTVVLGPYLASYAVEDWPDGRWRRLTLAVKPGRPSAFHLEAVARAFGFGLGPLHAERIMWGSQEGSRGAALNLAELIAAAPEPEAEEAVLWDDGDSEEEG